MEFGTSKMNNSKLFQMHELQFFQVITSSIDRTVKVWNLNNVFEQVHVIDRHELQIDSIR